MDEIEKKPSRFATPLDRLLFAASMAYSDLIKEALRMGASINEQNSAGCTALMFAVMPEEHGDYNSAESIKAAVDLLLSLGADPNIRDTSGMLAVDYARQFVDGQWRDSFGDLPSERVKPEFLLHIQEVIQKLEKHKT